MKKERGNKKSPLLLWERVHGEGGENLFFSFLINCKTQKEAVMADRIMFIGWNRPVPGR
jgi:hypothetical protein